MLSYVRGEPLSQIRSLHSKGDPAPDLNLWSWGPMKVHSLTPPKGYKNIPRTKGTIVQASLMSQLYDFELVIDLDNKATMWAKEEDIKQASTCPVILCHALEERQEGDHVYLLGPLPTPYHGSYAFVAEGENLLLYSAENLPEIKQKFLRVRQKIIDLADQAKPNDIDHLWVSATPLHKSIADESTYHLFKQQTISKMLGTSDPQKQAEYDDQLNKLLLFHDHILMIDRLLQVSDYQDRFQEIASMMQDLASDYYAFHQSSLSAPKSAPPVHSGIFDQKAIVPTNQPFITTIEAIQNAASGATRWQHQNRQPPYYSRKTDTNSTTIEYGRTSEQQNFEERAIANLWKDVKGFAEENTEGFTDRDGDLLLYTFSALIKETDGKGVAWIHASHFLDDRDMKPITKQEGAITRRAGHRTERIAEIERSMYRLSGLWINIEEIRPPRRKGGKQKVFRHKGRVFSVMETWSQETLNDDGKIQEKMPVAWKIRAGDWLMEYLEAPRFVAFLCDQSLKYDPENEKWEKRLSRYFLFFLRINGKHGNNTLVRGVGEIIQVNSLPVDERNPQRSRERFEKAMNRLLEDKQIDAWEYVAKSVIELPSKKWLDTWQKWQVMISVQPRPKLSGK